MTGRKPTNGYLCERVYLQRWSTEFRLSAWSSFHNPILSYPKITMCRLCHSVDHSYPYLVDLAPLIRCAVRLKTAIEEMKRTRL